jgi:hypothetical protein
MGGGSGMKLDLNAKRAARAAQRGGDGIQMILGEESFNLVDELPLEIGELAEQNRIGEAFQLMLRDPDTDMVRLKSCKPSFNDVLDVVEFFGTQLGESLKSAESSAITGQQSSQTSSTSTAATSPASATDHADSTPAVSSA